MHRFLMRIAVFLALLATITWMGLFLSTPTGKATPFTVAQGEGIAAISRRLKDEGYIRSTVFFRIALQGSDLATRIQPGSHDLSRAENYDEVIEELASGGLAAGEVVLRVIEGWDLRDIAEEVEGLGIASSEEFFAVTGEPTVDYRDYPSSAGMYAVDDLPYFADKPDHVSLEGYLFPDTYRVYADSGAEDIVEVMLENFVRRMGESGVADAAYASERDLFDIVTMASIIEREVTSDEDRRMVSDLFWRRFDIGMALQADSTVNYVTGKGHPAVSYDDTRVDSRYNTYKYPGLPLGPIGNPGLSALRAAADPEPNPYWYFLTDTEGNVHYGRDLDEHNRNKARYLK